MGWKHGNEKAGHIPYAKFFSAQWLDTRWRESCLLYTSVANRKTQNEKTLHADLLLAGIAQLVTVIVADKIHQHQYLSLIHI